MGSPGLQKFRWRRNARWWHLRQADGQQWCLVGVVATMHGAGSGGASNVMWSNNNGRVSKKMMGLCISNKMTI